MIYYPPHDGTEPTFTRRTTAAQPLGWAAVLWTILVIL